MKIKILSLCLVYLCMQVNSYASYTGYQLLQFYKEDRKMTEGDPSASQLQAGAFSGFVAAGTASLSFIRHLQIQETGWSIFKGWPKNVSIGQLVLVFGKYLEEHPEKLHEQGLNLYVVCIKENFPQLFQ